MLLGLDALRTTLHRAIATPRGDSSALVRVPKDLARRLNVTLGKPLCSAEEMTVRRSAQQRLADLRRDPRGGRAAAAPQRVAAPVKVYVEGDRNGRELARIRETLDARAIAYDVLDVAGDEATMDFVLRTAKCERDELPVVFVGPTAIGGFAALVEADVSGALARAL